MKLAQNVICISKESILFKGVFTCIVCERRDSELSIQVVEGTFIENILNSFFQGLVSREIYFMIWFKDIALRKRLFRNKLARTELKS